MLNNLTQFQKDALNKFDDELLRCIDHMIFIWMQKPFEDMFTFHYSSLEALCEYFELDYQNFRRILRNNGILDENNNATEFGINTGLVMQTPFGNPGMN